MNIQHFLTLSIDAIALFYSALMAANFVLRLLEEWKKSIPIPQGICAEILEPIFEEIPSLAENSPSTNSYPEIIDPWTSPASVVTESSLAVPTSVGGGILRELAEEGFSRQSLVPPPTLSPISVNSKIVLLLPSAKPANNLVQLNIRQLKKKASSAKVKNYNVMTKAQLIEALSA